MRPAVARGARVPVSVGVERDEGGAVVLALRDGSKRATFTLRARGASALAANVNAACADDDFPGADFTVAGSLEVGQ